MEAPFDTHDDMLRHVSSCSHLTKGSYKCCNCGKFESIHRIHTNSCHESRRFSSVTNSFRRAKRLLSSHGSKNRNDSGCTMQDISEKITVFSTSAEPPQSRPLDPLSNFRRSTSELDSFEAPEIREPQMPQEFAAYDGNLWYGGVQSQNTRSELSASLDSEVSKVPAVGQRHFRNCT
jgi:hypothetical protein